MISAIRPSLLVNSLGELKEEYKEFFNFKTEEDFEEREGGE